MSSNTQGALLLVFIAAVIIGSIWYAYSVAESCRPNEVVVRGAFGLVCVQGHRP
jgi:hypothetical protein